MLRRVPHNRFCGIYKRFSFLSAFHVFSSSTKHPGNDAVLAEHVYSQGVAHTHTLDNPNTFCAIPSRPASNYTAVILWLPLNIGVASYLNKIKLLSAVHKTQKITRLSVPLKRDSHLLLFSEKRNAPSKGTTNLNLNSMHWHLKTLRHRIPR